MQPKNKIQSTDQKCRSNKDLHLDNLDLKRSRAYHKGNDWDNQEGGQGGGKGRR